MIIKLSRLLLLGITLGATSACSHLIFFAVNAPAAFGDYTRIADVSYATQPRNKLDVYAPKRPHALAPVLIFIHGGGWDSGDKSQYKFVGAKLAEQGYVAVLPNYGLYPQVKSPVFLQDVASAVTWVHAHATEWGGDPDRLYLVGHSAGAQIAVMLALDNEYLQQAGGSSRWLRGVVGLAGPYDFLPFTYHYMNDLFGPPEKFAASQPINYVRADAPPLLLMHGLRDHTVDPNNTRHLQAALQAIGANVEAEYFADATHSDLIAAFSVVGHSKPPVLAAINRFVYGAAPAALALAQ